MIRRTGRIGSVTSWPQPVANPQDGALRDDGVAGAQRCSRRDTRQWVKRVGSGPIGGGGDSPLTHRPPGYRHDLHARADQSAAAVIDQQARGRAVFPRRRTGAKSQPTPSSLRQGAPVNRRYGHVEDALARVSNGKHRDVVGLLRSVGKCPHVREDMRQHVGKRGVAMCRQRGEESLLAVEIVPGIHRFRDAV